LTAYKDKTSLAQTFQALLKQAEQKEEEREPEETDFGIEELLGHAVKSL